MEFRTRFWHHIPSPLLTDFWVAENCPKLKKIQLLEGSPFLSSYARGIGLSPYLRFARVLAKNSGFGGNMQT